MLPPIIKITRNVLDRLKNKFDQVFNMSDGGDLEDIERYLDDEDRRHYTQHGEDVYSVTTVISELEGSSYALQQWKKNNDGEGDNPYWKHILEYKQDRGTLAHHAAMSEDYERVSGDGSELWSGDESSSLDRVMDREGDHEFLYSILADRGWVSDQESFNMLMEEEDIGISDVLMGDLDYFVSEYDRIMREKGVSGEDLEAVEKMFVVPPNHEHDGYGGQADLVYRDPTTGEAVVADLKTSSAIRDKHKYQAAAYAKAVEKTDDLPIDHVGRAEIIRIYPDEEESEVYSFTDFDQYWSEFAETTKEM